MTATLTDRQDLGAPKIRLFVNYEHIARVMRRRRELGIGEGLRAESNDG